MTSPSESAAARQLAEFLTQRGQYSSSSYLEDRVRIEIKGMAAAIAREIVESTPELGEIVRRKTREVVAAALREDSWLGERVVEAVAGALRQHVSGDDQ